MIGRGPIKNPRGLRPPQYPLYRSWTPLPPLSPSLSRGHIAGRIPPATPNRITAALAPHTCSLTALSACWGPVRCVCSGAQCTHPLDHPQKRSAMCTCHPQRTSQNHCTAPHTPALIRTAYVYLYLLSTVRNAWYGHPEHSRSARAHVGSIV